MRIKIIINVIDIREIYLRTTDCQCNSKETELHLIDKQISQCIHNIDCKKLTFQEKLILKFQIELLKQQKRTNYV